MGERIAVRIVIHGRVQGVGFRQWTARTARDRGLDGWVRNRRDGTVEAVFEGPPEAIRAMITECRHGPPAAEVESVEEATADESGAFDGFAQRATV